MKRLQKIRAVVPELMSPFVSKGYYLYVENWYTSKKLACYLLENGTLMCGTIVPSRLKYPKSMQQTKLRHAEFTF